MFVDVLYILERLVADCPPLILQLGHESRELGSRAVLLVIIIAALGKIISITLDKQSTIKIGWLHFMSSLGSQHLTIFGTILTRFGPTALAGGWHSQREIDIQGI
jgi:hypothetical protein